MAQSTGKKDRRLFLLGDLPVPNLALLQFDLSQVPYVTKRSDIRETLETENPLGAQSIEKPYGGSGPHGPTMQSEYRTWCLDLGSHSKYTCMVVDLVLYVF